MMYLWILLKIPKAVVFFFTGEGQLIFQKLPGHGGDDQSGPITLQEPGAWEDFSYTNYGHCLKNHSPKARHPQ